jgi:hypothetical protein
VIAIHRSAQAVLKIYTDGTKTQTIKQLKPYLSISLLAKRGIKTIKICQTIDLTKKLSNMRSMRMVQFSDGPSY